MAYFIKCLCFALVSLAVTGDIKLSVGETILGKGWDMSAEIRGEVDGARGSPSWIGGHHVCACEETLFLDGEGGRGGGLLVLGCGVGGWKGERGRLGCGRRDPDGGRDLPCEVSRGCILRCLEGRGGGGGGEVAVLLDDPRIPVISVWKSQLLCELLRSCGCWSRFYPQQNRIYAGNYEGAVKWSKIHRSGSHLRGCSHSSSSGILQQHGHHLDGDGDGDDMSKPPVSPLAVLLQPACTSHKWIRTPDTPHLMERPERIRAVLVGVAAATANLEIERAEEVARRGNAEEKSQVSGGREGTPDISAMMGGLSLETSGTGRNPNPGRPSEFIHLPQVVHPAGVLDPASRGKTLRHHPALQYAHSETPESPFPALGTSSGSSATPTSTYLPALLRWCLQAPEKVTRGECEIPRAGDGTEEGERLGLNPNDLYLGPGSVDAIEGCVSRSWLCCTRDRSIDGFGGDRS